MDGATVTAVLKTWQTLSNGEFPVVIRVTHNRKPKYIGTGQSSTKGRWNQDQNEIYGKNKETRAVQKKFSDVRRDVIKCVEIHGCFTFEKFMEIHTNKKSKKTMLDFWEDHLRYLRKVDRDGTADSYENAKKKFEEFSGKKKYTLDQITRQVFEEFRDYMLQKQSSNGTGIYLRSMKAVYGEALKKDLVKPEKDPRMGIKLKMEKTTKKALSSEQLYTLMNLDLSSKPHFVESRMLFLFSYYCQGMNFKDMCRLRIDQNLLTDRIVYNRGKTTEDHFVIKIRPAVREILDDMEDLRNEALKKKKILNDTAKNLLFRVYDRLTESQFKKPELRKAVRNQRAKLMTEHLRKMVDMINEIYVKDEKKPLFLEVERKLLTFYSARHTYATMLKKSNAPVSLISEALGHSDIRTTETYLDSFGNDELDKFNDLFLLKKE